MLFLRIKNEFMRLRELMSSDSVYERCATSIKAQGVQTTYNRYDEKYNIHSSHKDENNTDGD